MSDSYKYVDPKYTYIDFQTGVLKNLQGITDSDVLLFFESSAVTKRLQELNEDPIMIKGTVSLLEIHKYLFQDVYAWAGKQRTVDISKDGKQFFPISNFDTAFQYIDYLITEFKGIPKTNKVLISEKLAEILEQTLSGKKTLACSPISFRYTFRARCPNLQKTLLLQSAK